MTVLWEKDGMDTPKHNHQANGLDVAYTSLSKRILRDGVEQENRTDRNARFVPGAMIQHDLQDGAPAITTKKLAFKSSIGEVLGFFRGYENAADFAALGCKFWFSDANKNAKWLNSPWRKGKDDLGKVYGSTWRNREVIMRATNNHELQAYMDEGYVLENQTENGVSYLNKNFDQLRDCVDAIINRPTDRRIIMHAWFPELFPQMALPPCHVLYEFIPDVQNKTLHVCMFQRSCDNLLGVPMNIFALGLMTEIIAKACGYKAGTMTHFLGNAHFYDNQYEQAEIQAKREPKELGQLVITKKPEEYTTDAAMVFLETLEPADIEVANYESHPPLERVEMAQETVKK